MKRRRYLRSLVPTALAAAAVMLVDGSPAGAANSTIDVPCGGVARLRVAIEAANGRAGADTISLAPSCTYTIADEYSDNEALPAFLKKSITLEGNGATIRRAEGALDFRLIHVAVTGRLVIHNLTVSNGSHIGAVWVDGDLFVTDSRINNNRAGGVLVASTGQASFVDSDISGNTLAGFLGAGIKNHGLLYLEGVWLSLNDIPAVMGQASGGGGLYNAGSAIVYKSFVRANRARDGAGILNAGDLLVLESAIWDNDTDTGVPSQNIGFGSAIRSTGTLEVVNSSIANNWSLYPGGAIEISAGTASFRHATIAHNATFSDASGAVGGLVNLVDEATIELETTILSNNVVGRSVQHRSNCAGALIDRGYVLTDDASGCPATFLRGDPKLDGRTFLQGDRVASVVWIPGVGSAALDRIPPPDPYTLGPACASIDQRGMPRPGGPACDIGAYENQAPSTPGPISASASPSQGAFALSWGAATDPDGDAVSYRLESRAFNEQAWTLVWSTSAPQFMFGLTAPEREGRLHYQVAASDDRLPSPDFGLSGEVVVDRTPPLAPAPAADRVPEYVDPATGAAWFADAVTVSFTPGKDPPLADGSPGSGIVSTTGPQTFTIAGAHTATGSSTDAAGNRSPDAAYTVHVDADPPVVVFGSCPAAVVLGANASIGWSATDAGSGLAGQASGTVSLDTSSIGSYTATHSVSDNVGHSSTASCTYNVIWDFRGFRAPLRSYPSFSTIGVGSVVHVVFSLAGNQGLDVFASGYPASAPIVCSPGDVIDAGELTTSLNSLTFSPSTGEYTYSWVSKNEWRGTCRQLIVKLRDGTFHRANLESK